MDYDFQLINVSVSGRVAEVVINNPPINLITPELYRELVDLVSKLKDDDRLSVVIFKSADPDFFIAHYDVENILRFPIDGEAERQHEPSEFHLMCERLRTMNKVTIAQIEGRAGGGGSEFAASMDMRFGVIDKTRINQMEVPLGILPGGTGTQRLPRLVGRARAMEIILGGEDLDAATAERWGYLILIYPADQISAAVAALAQRIASFPQPALRLAKAAINASSAPLKEGLQEEAYLFARLLRTEEAQENMRKFLQIGGQTREGELKVDELAARLGELKD